MHAIANDVLTGRDMMVSGRNMVPWHGLGAVTSGLMTGDEALALSGCDWTVEKRPLYIQQPMGDDDSVLLPVADTYANTRSDTGQVFGISKKQYVPTQNADLFGFLQAIQRTNRATVDTMGALYDGRMIFMSCVFGEDFTIGDETFARWIVALNTHDAKKSLTVKVVPIRIVCKNTMLAASAAASASYSLSHRNLHTLEGREGAAREALGFADSTGDLFVADVERLYNTPVSERRAKNIITKAMGTKSAKAEDHVDTVLAFLATSDTISDDMRNTGWGLMNAVTEWTTHRAYKGGVEARVKGLVIGGQATSDEFAGRVRDLILAK